MSYIRLVNVTKRFGNVTAVDNLNLEIGKGECFSMLGPSGCGKSTLLRCINGLEPIQGGSIKLHGEPVEHGKPSLYKVRQKIGMVFQSYDLFPHMTVMKNITLAPLKVQNRSRDEVTEKAMALLKRVGLDGKADSYPSELSGGQKQRISIARVFLKNPPILILDEATSALDNESERWIQQSLEELAKNRTTITIAHRLSTIRNADEILVVANNGIAERGNHDELLEQGGIYAHYYEMS